MYHVDEGLEGPVIDADDLREFSPEDRRQVLQVMQQVGRNLDLIVYIKSNGREDFTFIGELEVRFNYFFIDDANPQLEPIVKRNNVRKFKIQAPVYCPFDYGFDFQIINPLVRHMNYESNNMKKSFLVNEPGLIVFNIENRGQRIQLKRVAISPNEANRDKYNVIRVAELKGMVP